MISLCHRLTCFTLFEPYKTSSSPTCKVQTAVWRWCLLIHGSLCPPDLLKLASADDQETCVTGSNFSQEMCFELLHHQARSWRQPGRAELSSWLPSPRHEQSNVDSNFYF